MRFIPVKDQKKKKMTGKNNGGVAQPGRTAGR